MKVIRPTTINDSRLVSSTVAEDDYAAWSSATSYALGARSIKAHRIWESSQASNTNHDPETSGPTWWVDIGPTNRWGMFDEKVGTVTTATDELTVVIAPGRFDSLALLQLSAASVTITMTVGAEVVYEHTESLIDDSEITDWYQYYFEPIRPKDYLLLMDIPIYGEAETTITLTKNSGTVSIGMCIVGMQSDVGGTLNGVTLGINDYSKKSTDDFGNTTLVQRSFSKRMGAKLMVDNSEVDRVHAALSSLRSVPAVWVGYGRYSSMLVYGFFGTFEIDVAYASFSYCSLNIEGMI